MLLSSAIIMKSHEEFCNTSIETRNCDACVLVHESRDQTQWYLHVLHGTD